MNLDLVQIYLNENDGGVGGETKEEVIPEDGIFHLGANNPSAVQRFARRARRVIKSGAVLPRAKFIDYIATRITGKDKQDFSMILSGRKGSGKSYSSLRICMQVADAVAEKLKGKPEDYFTMSNCCLLEDTEGINKLIKTAGKHQIILLDDAGVAVGSRDFSTTKNKNFNKLLATCRTQRWMILLNVPAKSHIDKQIRELVDCWGKVYMPLHALGFNILKINSVEINESSENKPYMKKYIFKDKNSRPRKIDLWAVQSPDEATAREYDVRRDEAAQKIIEQQMTGEEAPELSKREMHRQNMLNKYSERIIQMINDGKSASEVVRKCPGLSDSMLRTLRAELGV